LPKGSDAKGQSFRTFFGPLAVGVSAFILIGAVFLPSDGLGVDLCSWKVMTGHPCPGCGLSRSVRNLAHGEAGLAFSYHPFGFLVLPYAVLAVSTLAWPRTLKASLRRKMDRRHSSVMSLAGVVLALFLLFGVVRFLLSWASLWPPY